MTAAGNSLRIILYKKKPSFTYLNGRNSRQGFPIQTKKDEPERLYRSTPKIYSYIQKRILK